MQFLYQYPDLRGTEGDLLDAGDVGEVATAVALAATARTGETYTSGDR